MKEKETIARALRVKLDADLHELNSSVSSCRRCPGGGGGLAGAGRPGARVLLLAGSPGPGSSQDEPWGELKAGILAEIERSFPGIAEEELYFTVALRCPGVKVSARALRRCSLYLAEEIHLVGPATVMAFGRPAAVALRMAMGEDLPASPRAGDQVILQGRRYAYNLEPSKLRDPEVGEIFRKILLAAIKGK